MAALMRLGILGGTFDPIHHGHLLAAQEAHYQLCLDRVLFVPAGSPHHKPEQPVTAPHHRLRMIELAIAGKVHFGISQVDLDRPAPCYTLDTLRLLRAEIGTGIEFLFLIGSDSLADIRNWHRPSQILELCDLAVVRRPGFGFDLKALEAQIPGLTEHLHWIQMPLLEISSSNLRQRVKSGKPISYLVPGAVERYIEEQRLYGPVAEAGAK